MARSGSAPKSMSHTGTAMGGSTMTLRAVVTLAAFALWAGVFVSEARAAPPTCGSKNCGDEQATACAGLSGGNLSACKKCVISECKLGDCSCIGDPNLPSCDTMGPICNPPTTTTTTTTTTTSTTTSSTTTTTTSTTTTTTSTTTTTTQSVGGAFLGFLEFTTGTPGGSCGNTLDGSNALIRNLTCGGLNIGGGGSTLGEGLTPD